MKKQIFRTLILVSLILSLVACGKSKEEKELEEIQKELEAEGLGELGELAEAFAEEEKLLQKEKELEAEIQSEYKLYDKSSEWDKIENPLLAIQIDDTFYEFGTTVEDVINKIKSSKMNYTLMEDSYTDDMIVDNAIVVGGRSIKVQRDGINWFRVYYHNPTDDLLPIKDCIFYNIEPYENALPYTWVLGISQDELMSIAYDEIEAKLPSLPGLDNGEMKKINSTTWQIKKDIVSNVSDKRYLFPVTFEANIDEFTGKIGTYNTYIAFPEEYYDLTPLETFDGLNDEAFTEIVNSVNNIYEENWTDDYSTVKIAQVCLTGSKYDDYNKVEVYLEAQLIDSNSKVYLFGSVLAPPAALADDSFIHLDKYNGLSFMGWEYDSLEEIKDVYQQDIIYSEYTF